MMALAGIGTFELPAPPARCRVMNRQPRQDIGVRNVQRRVSQLLRRERRGFPGAWILAGNLFDHSESSFVPDARNHTSTITQNNAHEA